jgi:hypothetical protein
MAKAVPAPRERRARVVVLCGYIGAGKTTAADILDRQQGFRLFALGTAPRACVQEIFGLTDTECEDRALKEAPGAASGVSYRQAMQVFATDVVRDQFGALFPGLAWDPRETWIRAVDRDMTRWLDHARRRLWNPIARGFAAPLQPHGRLNLDRMHEGVGRMIPNRPVHTRVRENDVPLPLPPAPLHPGFAVTDARFPEEFDWFRREWRARVLWIRRAGCGPGAHASESADYARFADAAVDNDGTREELCAAVSAAVATMFD